MKTRHMKGSTPLPDRLKDKATHTIELSDAKYKAYTSAKYFTETRVKTAAEMTAQDAAEEKENTRKAAKEVRNEALNNLTVDLNGNLFQARPQDEVNFRLSVETMSDTDKEEWILANNTVIEVTKADLLNVYSQGLAASKAIYQTYKEALKAL